MSGVFLAVGIWFALEWLLLLVLFLAYILEARLVTPSKQARGLGIEVRRAPAGEVGQRVRSRRAPVPTDSAA